MLTLDELLAQLRARGLNPNILALVAAELQSEPGQPIPQSLPLQYGPHVGGLQQNRQSGERSTKQKRCFRAAVKAAYPDGVPPGTTDYRLANDVRLQLARKPKPVWWCEISTDTIADHAKKFIEGLPKRG